MGKFKSKPLDAVVKDAPAEAGGNQVGPVRVAGKPDPILGPAPPPRAPGKVPVDGNPDAKDVRSIDEVKALEPTAKEILNAVYQFKGREGIRMIESALASVKRQEYLDEENRLYKERLSKTIKAKKG
jgi:hypothetical protein